MQKVINTCDRCGKTDTKEGVSAWGAEIPRTWRYENGKLLCDDCLKEYEKAFDSFMAEKDEEW